MAGCNILLADGSSSLLLVNGIDHLLQYNCVPSSGVNHCYILQTDGASAVLLANAIDHLLQYDCVPDVTAAIGTVGGTRRHHVPGGRHVRRREWLRLLEEIRLEQEALEAPSRAKAAQAAVRKAKRAAVDLAEQLQLAEAIADREALAREIIAAERASKAGDALRMAEAAMDMIRDIQNRIDEDEDDVLMLGAAL